MNRREFWQALLAMFGLGAIAGTEWDVVTAGGDRDGGEFGKIKNFAFVESKRFAPGYFAIGDIITFGAGPHQGSDFEIVSVDPSPGRAYVKAREVFQDVAGRWYSVEEDGWRDYWLFEWRRFSEYGFRVVHRPEHPGALPLYPGFAGLTYVNPSVGDIHYYGWDRSDPA